MQRHPKVRWFAWFGVMVMAISSFSGVAHASPVPPGARTNTCDPLNIQIANKSVTAFVGTSVKIAANITGGCPWAPNPTQLFPNGYSTTWFWGDTNFSGALQTSRVVLAGASDCTSASQNSSLRCTKTYSINASYTWNVPGSYNVSVTVYDPNFNYNITTFTVTVIQPAFKVALESPHSYNGVINSTEGFRLELNAWATPASFLGLTPANLTPSLNWRWNFGDGNTSTGQVQGCASGVSCTVVYDQVNHIYTQSGTYVVTITALNPATGQGGRGFATVRVTDPSFNLSCPGFPLPPPPAPPYISAPFPVGAPVPFNINVINTTGPDLNNITFNWSFGDGTNGYGAHPTHVYQAPGYYPLYVSAQDEEGKPAGIPLYEQVGCYLQDRVHIVSPGPSSKSPGGVTVPVGQVAFVPANASVNIPSGAALYNYTWSRSSVTSYGSVGRFTSYTPSNANASLTATSPYGSASASRYVNFTDVAPTVGIDSFYTEASITLTVEDPSDYDFLNFTLYENGVDMGYYNMSYYYGSTNSVTFKPIDFQMSDQWSIGLKYTPYGDTGGSWVDLGFAWTDDNTYVDNYDATEPDTASDTWSYFFHNANSSANLSTTLSVNQQAIGEPVFGHVTFFSPATTSFTETWTMGDGNVYTYTDSAPTTAKPTFYAFTWEYAWYSGANYTFTVKVCDQFGKCGTDRITVYNQYSLTASDTAPFVSLRKPLPDTPEGMPVTATANVTEQNQATVGYYYPYVTWGWGDQTVTNSSLFGGTQNATHVYQYGAKYVVVVYARSIGGSTSANWTFINVTNPPPQASMLVTNASGTVDNLLRPSVNTTIDVPVTFNGSLSTDYATEGPTDLSFSWDFGDGTISGGNASSGMTVSHFYTRSGTYMVVLAVQDVEGAVGYAYENVTVSPNPPQVVLMAHQVTVDQAIHFPLAFFPALGHPLPFINVTWNWGDGGVGYGLSPAWHTYFAPGNYTIGVNLTGGPFQNTVTHVTARVTVVDAAPQVLVPYTSGTRVYGENHSAVFESEVLGTLADSTVGGNGFSFAWNWGDGTSGTSSLGANTSVENHFYNLSGIENLNVTVTTPFAPGFLATSYTSTSLNCVEDSDGDGLPDVYEVEVGHTNPYLPNTFLRDANTWGNGFTDYFAQYVPKEIQNLSADNDGDGLSNMQEILGSVTGFPSNPLDANTAGDGIPDGSHIFSQSFPASRTVSLSSRYSVVPIMNVTYPGPAIAFNSSKILVVFNTSVLTAIKGVFLEAANGVTFLLGGTPTSNAMTYNLLNYSPETGQRPFVFQAQYSVACYNFTGTQDPIAVSDFMTPGTWNLTVCSNGVAGTVATANMAITYWGDPGHADPTHQGMLQGHTLTIPVLNCTTPLTATYPVFDDKALTLTNQTYAPWTEQYFKLSHQQGVPYVLGYNASVYQNNTVTGNNCPGLPQWLLGATATYLGDQDFGLSVWNAHAAGDPGLTNGMKALGALNYTATAGKYIHYYWSWSPGADLNGTDNGYPADPLYGKYNGPLNPSTLSTAGDGVADSVSANPVAPLALEVWLNSTVDPSCAPFKLGTPNDIMSVTLTSGGGSNPVIYTPAQSPSSSSGATCDLVLPGADNFAFNMNDVYLFPLALGASHESLQFDTWQNNTLTTSGAVRQDTLSISISLGATVATNDGNLEASARVVQMTREPVVLVNNTGEVNRLPGYGLRYVGEQQFYAFYLNVYAGASGTPFQSGENVVLESRASFLASPLNSSLFCSSCNSNSLNGSGLGFLWNATITARPGSAGLTGVVGTVEVNVTGSQAVTLLNQLMPLNATGAHTGSSEALSMTQFELLGLDSQALELSPFVWLSPVSKQGTPPQTILGELGGYIVSGLEFVAGAIVAFGTLVVQIASLVVHALIQFIVGLLQAAYAAVAAAVQAIEQAFLWLLNLVVSALEAVVNALISAITNSMTPVSTKLAEPALSLEVNNGLMKPSDYTNVTGGTPMNNSTAYNNMNYGQWGVVAPIAALVAGATAAALIAAASSGGLTAIADKIVGLFAKDAIKNTIANILRAAATVAAFSLAELAMTNLTAAAQSISYTTDARILQALGFAATVYLSWARVTSSLGQFFISQGANIPGVTAVAGLVMSIIALAFWSYQYVFKVQLPTLARLGIAALSVAAGFIGVYWAAINYRAGLGMAADLVPEPLLTSSQILPGAMAGTGVVTMVCIAAGTC
jgi:hypothetical protein